MGAIFQVSGKDSFGCKSQLKADGFKWYEPLRAWFGTSEAIEKFQSRGFRVKVFFTRIECRDQNLHAIVTGTELPAATY